MTGDYDWDDPIPLGDYSLPKWPENVFPPEIQAMVDELSRSTETPRELASLTVLSVLATAAQGKFVVQIKPDYFEPVNLWTAVSLPPASRKSAVINTLIHPLIAWEKERQKEIQPIREDIISKNKTLEMKIKEMRRQNIPAEQFDEFQAEIRFLETQIQDVPSMPQIWTGDVTSENLAVLMAENYEKMAIIADEAGIFDVLAGRYSGGIPNLDIFLQGHSGSSVRVNRGSRPPVYLERATLTIGLVPQPSVLKSVAANDTFKGRGLLARFLYAFPKSNLGERSLDAPSIDPAVKATYQEKILAILNCGNPAEAPRPVRLSQAAYDEWHAYSLVIEVKMGENGPFAHITDWAGKLAGAIARMAGLLHISRHAECDPDLVEISLADMKAAIKKGHVLAEHALAVFDYMGADKDLEGARKILSWIKHNRWLTFTFRDCHYAHKSLFKRAQTMAPAIAILIERHFIRAVDEGNNGPGRPSRLFDVNPLLYPDDHANVAENV